MPAISVNPAFREALEAAPEDTRAWAEIGLKTLVQAHGWDDPDCLLGLAVDIGIAAAEARRGCLTGYRQRERFVEAVERLLCERSPCITVLDD